MPTESDTACRRPREGAACIWCGTKADEDCSLPVEESVLFDGPPIGAVIGGTCGPDDGGCEACQ
jgi:hypothetical protein